jgi:hypothetical protein
MAACLHVAATGPVRPADAATVNGVLFLNTSSVGVYVNFVRARERIEGWGLGYRSASALAAVWCWLGLRGYAVGVREGEREGDAGGAATRVRSCSSRSGSGSSRCDGGGGRVEGGQRALHLMVLRARSRPGAWWRAWVRAAGPGGVASLARTDALDVAVVAACELTLRRPRGRVALDGELAPLTAPLHYRYIHDALLVVAPPGGSVGGGDGAGVRT